MPARYLIETKVIDDVAQHGSVALFCSKYLLSPPFNPRIEESEIRKHMLAGYYALQDYVVSSIFDHFIAASEKKANDQSMLPDKLWLALQSFVAEYGKAPEFKDKLSDIGELQRRLPSDLAKRYALFDLEERTSVLRSVLESVRSDDSLQQDKRGTLNTIYGFKSFKCPRPWCLRFENGLDTFKDRERHVHKHDNPFICPDDQCPLHEVGFDTESSLNQHIRRYHASTHNGTQPTFPKPRSHREDTLWSASERGDLASVRKHINNGADVNKPTRAKGIRTPLDFAAQKGHLAICHMLVKHGAKLLDEHYYGRHPRTKTALKVAIMHGHEDVVRYLLSLDCAINKDGHRSAVWYAARSGNRPILKMILDSHDSRSRVSNLGDALVIAAGMDHVDAVSFLLRFSESEPHVDPSDVANWRMIRHHDWRFKNGQSLNDVVLWANSAHVSDTKSRTPLHMASRNGNADIVQILLNANANPSPLYLHSRFSSPADFSWETPLYSAAEHGYADVVQLLLAAQADPNEPCNGLGPLHAAARNGHAETVRLLIDSNRINPNLGDMPSRSALHLAIRGGHLGVAKQIADMFPAQAGALFAWASSENNENVTACLLGLGIFPVDPRSLYKAAVGGDEKAVRAAALAPQAAVSSGEHRPVIFDSWYAIPNTDVEPVVELDLLLILGSEGVHGMTFSEDRRYLAVNGKRRVFLYGTLLGNEIDSAQVSENHGAHFVLQGIYFSPDGNHLVGRGEDNVLWLWQILNQVTSTFTTSHIGPIEAVCYTPNGHYLVTCGSDRTARVWNTSPGELFHVHTIDIGYHALSMAISFDSRHLAIGAPNGTIWLWNLAAGPAPPTCVPNPDSRTWKIDSLSFSTVGYDLVSCGLDGSIRVCHLKPEYSGRPLRVGTVRTAQGQCENALDARLTSDLRWLLSCKSTGDVLVQSTTTGVIHTVLKAHPDKAVALACSSSGSVFASASSDGQVRVWKMQVNPLRSTKSSAR
ncbi:hypothetical protein ASPCAL01846 [Aspergillus calidoustus]|uniref:Uncharacterized protein n=1 Tax=Aspergillus calidoustus TaxID=454130 RepID=A0A0U5GK27_ASPCI|nr:hypothetical protein ASPCAL01846 [Aspergillus calidoustus]